VPRLLGTRALPEQSAESIMHTLAMLAVALCLVAAFLEAALLSGPRLRRGDARLQSQLADFGRGLPAGIAKRPKSPRWPSRSAKPETAQHCLEGAVRPARNRGRDVEHFWKEEFRS
jgi:hypothetical protein